MTYRTHGGGIIFKHYSAIEPSDVKIPHKTSVQEMHGGLRTTRGFQTSIEINDEDCYNEE